MHARPGDAMARPVASRRLVQTHLLDGAPDLPVVIASVHVTEATRD
jgi:hypothetical protein